jgi:hypothetical protein
MIMDVNVHGTIKSVDDLVSKKAPVCIPKDIAEKVWKERKELKELTVLPHVVEYSTKSAASDLLGAMDTGLCEAVIMSEVLIKDAFRDNNHHCENKTILPDHVAFFDEAAPVHAEDRQTVLNKRALGYHAFAAVYDGKLAAFRKAEAGLAEDSCTIARYAHNQLNVYHFIGLFAVLFLVAGFVPIVIKLYSIHHDAKWLRDASEEDKEGYADSRMFSRTEIRYAHFIADVMATHYAVDRKTGLYKKLPTRASTDLSSKDSRWLRLNSGGSYHLNSSKLTLGDPDDSEPETTATRQLVRTSRQLSTPTSEATSPLEKSPKLEERSYCI